jgi:hypothetical protein
MSRFYDDIKGTIMYIQKRDNLGNRFHGAALSGTDVSAESVLSGEFLGASRTNEILFTRVRESMPG